MIEQTAETTLEFAEVVGAAISTIPGFALVPFGISITQFLFKSLQKTYLFKKTIPEKLHAQMHEAIKKTGSQIKIANHRKFIEDVKMRCPHLFDEILSSVEAISMIEGLLNDKIFLDGNYFTLQDRQNIKTAFYNALRNELVLYPELMGFIHWEAIDNLNKFKEKQEVFNTDIDGRVSLVEDKLNNITQETLARLLTFPPPKANQNFIGRTNEVNKIAEVIKSKKKLVLVNGMGGIGKSEIAKRLFHLWNDKGVPGCDEIVHFGWIQYTGDIRNTLSTSLYRTMKIEKIEDAYHEAIRYINELGKSLILFVDNLNNPTKEDTETLASLTCNVVLTSRTNTIAQFENVIIGKLSEDECFEIYTLYCPEVKNEENTVRHIIRKADCHTLAIELLAKTQEAAHITSKELLERLEKVGFTLEGIDETVEQNGNDAIFIEHIAKLFSLANISEDQKHILQLFSILPYRPLQGEYLKRWFNQANYNIVNALVKNGWLIEGDDTTFLMHPVISGTILYSTKPEYQVITSLIYAISEDLNVEKTGIFTEKLPLIPFAESVASYCIKWRNETFEVSLLESCIANILTKQAEYAKALEWYGKSLEIYERILGKEHPDTAAIYNGIAFTYTEMGNFSAAIELYEKVLFISEKELGKEHPDTATVYDNIAHVYQAQGKYVSALTWYEKALIIRENILGKKHPDTGITYTNIALVFSYMAKYETSLEWYRKALWIGENVLEKGHPDTAAVYNGIALVYARMGDYENSLKWNIKALEIIENVLGKEHPHTATMYSGIADIYLHTGKYNKSLELFEKALVIEEKVLGNEHPHTLSTYNNIALAYDSMGEYIQALEWYGKAYMINEHMSWKHYPFTATLYNNIANTLSHMGGYDKALGWHEKALEIRERIMGKDNPDTANSYNDIAFVYHVLGEHEKSLILYRKAYEVFLFGLGANHPHTQVCYKNILDAYLKTGRDKADFERWLSTTDNLK